MPHSSADSRAALKMYPEPICAPCTRKHYAPVLRLQSWIALALGDQAAGVLIMQTCLPMADDLLCRCQVDAIRLLLTGSSGRSATDEEEAAALSLARDESVMTALSEARPALANAALLQVLSLHVVPGL